MRWSPFKLSTARSHFRSRWDATLNILLKLGISLFSAIYFVVGNAKAS